jgi:hypothetical protein
MGALKPGNRLAGVGERVRAAPHEVEGEDTDPRPGWRSEPGRAEADRDRALVGLHHEIPTRIEVGPFAIDEERIWGFSDGREPVRSALSYRIEGGFVTEVRFFG